MSSNPAVAHLTVRSPLGPLSLFEDEGRLVALDWGRTPQGEVTDFLREAARQLDAYFAGTLKTFDLPMTPVGTDFQRRVWNAMVAIPFGETRSYGAVAGILGSAARAVGGACGRNPIPIIIPCHRITASGGRLGGYSGFGGSATKHWLLEHEQLT